MTARPRAFRLATLVARVAASLAVGLAAMPARAQDAPAVSPDLFAGFTTADADGPFLEPRWPDRVGPVGTRGIVRELTRTRRPPRSYGASPLFPDGSSIRAGAALVEAAGLPEGTGIAAEGVGAQIWDFGPRAGADDISPTPGMAFEFITGRLASRAGAAPAPPHGEHEKGPPGSVVEIDRGWFTFADASGQAGASPPGARGLLVLMPGLFGLPEQVLDTLERRARRDGWAVCRMLSQPARFVERRELVLDAGTPGPTGATLAEIMDQRSADCAYAVQAVVREIESRRPELRGKRRAILGISAGAMTLPTVVALEPDRYAAAVLIGGGCNFWHITRTSNYTVGTRIMTWTWRGLPPNATPDAAPGATPDAAQMSAVDAAFLDHSTLDSYHTARALHGKPVLMLHGGLDQAVPAPLGDLLWRRLGRPERWSYSASHEGITLTGLPPLLPKIMDWLNAAVPAADEGHRGAGGAEGAGGATAPAEPRK